MVVTFSVRGRFVRSGNTPASSLNIANIITVLRILLAPVMVILLSLDAGEFLRWVVAAVFVFAIASDALDGFLARSRNLITDLGKLIDPIADKILIGTALIFLSILGELSWWVTGIILTRELGITVFRFIALKDRVIPADMLGKLKTIAQAVAVSYALTPLPFLGQFWWWFGAVLMACALVLTLVSGVAYLWAARRKDS